MDDIKKMVEEINKGEIGNFITNTLGSDWPIYYETVEGITSVQICDAEDWSAQSVLDIEECTLTEAQLSKMIKDFEKLI